MCTEIRPESNPVPSKNREKEAECPDAGSLKMLTFGSNAAGSGSSDSRKRQPQTRLRRMVTQPHHFQGGMRDSGGQTPPKQQARFHPGAVPFCPAFKTQGKIFYIIFSVLRIFHLTFNLTRCMVLKILRQTAQQNGSSDPLRSAVRDCLGYTVRTMRKVFRLKFASAGRSSASSSAVTIALNFRPPARKGSSRTII